MSIKKLFIIFAIFLIASSLIESARAKTLKVDTLQASVTDGDISLIVNGTGDIVLGTFSGVLKSTSGVISAGDVNLSSEVTGALPEANGGTGTTDMSTILVELTGAQTIGGTKTFSDSMTLSSDLTMSGTGVLLLPNGTTAQRPGSPSAGMFRYNTENPGFEGYSNGEWGAVGGISNPLELEHITTPSNPSADTSLLYIKADRLPYLLDEDGVEVQLNSSVAQANLYGSVEWSTTTNCAWQRVSSTPGNFSADADCDDNARTVYGANNSTSGAAANSDGQLPQIKFSSIPAGTLKCSAVGAFSQNSTQDSFWRFSDGTNVTVVQNTYGSAAIFPVITGEFVYATPQAATTIQLQSWQSGASGNSEILVNTTQRAFKISCYHYPAPEQIITGLNPNYDGTAYTPTFTGFGTPSAVSVWHKREGDSVKIWGRATLGTRTGTEARISLPTGLTSASSISTIEKAGEALWSGSASESYYILREPSVAYATFSYQGAGGLTKQNGNAIFTDGTTISFEFYVPIDGWEDSNILTAVVPRKVAYIKDVKSAGTGGGTFTQGAWQTRTLNTVEGDSDLIVSLSSNQFTLTPGTYAIDIIAPANSVADHIAKLYNITAAADSIIGTANAANSIANIAHVSGQVTLLVNTTFEVRHYCSLTKATDGFGTGQNFSVSNVFTVVRVEKLK